MPESKDPVDVKATTDDRGFSIAPWSAHDLVRASGMQQQS